ncbi:hypothetical protein [Peribacillus sp. FSL E2-0218]|uniref:hypothetical protein n=1 Tax=Peribacillus sp. FSL E2-0218 TaxID=2921364 RepID=UPI0030ECC979
MLLKPHHARCDDRSESSKKHKVAGEAEDWFSNALLNEYELSGVNFDFFVNWNNETLSNEFWVKRLVNEDEIKSTKPEFIQELIYSCDSEEFVKDLAQLAKGSLKYKLFRESTDWAKQTEEELPILTVDIDVSGAVRAVSRESLDTLKKEIQTLSGGPVRVSKGLNYSYSTLECYLSSTDSAWPGDVDLILLDNKKVPKAIIEFKKHTLWDKIEDHKFEKYYKETTVDRRKYNRLAILRDAIGKDIPLLVVYYPTREEFNYIIIEEALGTVNDLYAGRSWALDLPVDKKSQSNLIEKIIEIIHS